MSTQAPITQLINEDGDRVDLESVFESVVENALNNDRRFAVNDVYELPVAGTDLIAQISAGYDCDESGAWSWMSLTVVNGNGETVWERQDDLDWESTEQIPQAFTTWFHQV